MNKHIFDVIIIGGSYAGLSAAMALGRSLRKTLVLDSGEPCNRQTPNSHNFLTQDGRTPKELATLAREQVEKYGSVQQVNDLAIEAGKENDSFKVFTESGQIYEAKKLVFATGIKDQMPGIEGFSDCWGISVVHCPYCHGYEYRSQNTGILANGEIAFHLAPMINNLTNELTIFTNGKADFTGEQREKLQKHHIPIVETEITEIEHEKGYLKNIIFRDGTSHPLTVLYARVPFTQHTDIPAALGCELTEQGHIKTDGLQKTTVPGVFACGDNSSMMRSVANAVSTGNLAGAMANIELAEEEF